MNIIIPLGGKGERFYKECFDKPKPLINILQKPMIFHVIDSLVLQHNDKLFIIYYNKLNDYNFEQIIKTKYPHIILIPIHFQTSGAVETISYGLEYIKTVSQNQQCVLLDCDTFYTCDLLDKIRTFHFKNIVFYTKKFNENPIYSYIELEQDNKITDIKEKTKISSNANTGCYVFEYINVLADGCKYILDNKITFNGEPYTSCVISQLINTNEHFYGLELNERNIISVGTPTELKQYLNNTFVFLFDLDGTLVNTDHIYFEVWKTILQTYNIDLTYELFKKYIHGNSDNKVVQMLIPSAELQLISELKDRLFIESINNIQIIDGTIKFLELIKSLGYHISIVTNCNRSVGEKIIEYCKFDKYIDYITIGSECAKAKPYPEPYIETMTRYNISSNQVVIFEDSKSGLLSGRLANPHCLIGITTNYNSEELISNGANITIQDFTSVDLNEILYYNNLSMNNIKKYITNSLNLQITDIIINETKLKGGYISDVIVLKIITDKKTLNCILKLENKNETKLSIMAKKLDLYERENYFYDTISKYININCPEFYGLVRDDNLNVIGILMENLNISGCYSLNLDLNTLDINISLGVISELAKFHSKYWNRDIKNTFQKLKKNDDPLFNPGWKHFINNNWDTFKDNWSNILSQEQLLIAENIKNNFTIIQTSLSNSNLTLIHGDVKSPNIFYDLSNNYKPTFLDWQYIAIGKGVQDMIFFLIESFDLDNIKLNYPIFKNYYYKKLKEFGVQNYSYNEYENDLKNAVCYFPFFVAIWFGTTPQDELIDKNFPFFFIQKLFFFLEQLNK
jgi:HAD superfamily hydrolase (TIGR01509 family)